MRFGVFRRSSARSSRGRSRPERAATLVEAALTLPVFILLVLGILEFGLGFRSYLTVSNSAQAGARTATTVGNQVDADFLILANLREALSTIPVSEIQQIIVFKATGPNSTLDDAGLVACRTGSQTNKCNTYTGADLTASMSSFGCGNAALDRFWCPTARKTALADPPDYVGVMVKIRHDTATGLFGTGHTVEDDLVMRIEPVLS